MKKVFVIGLILFACRHQSPSSQDGPEWVGGGLVLAMARAQTENRFLVVLVEAKWCPTCRQLDHDVFSRGVLPPKLLGIRIDFDSPEGQAVASRHRVISLPTTIVFRPDGVETGRLIGYESSYVNDLLRILESKTPTLDTLLEQLSTDEPSTLVETGTQLLYLGEEQKGLTALGRARALDPNDELGIWRKATDIMGRYHLRVRRDPNAALPYFAEGASRANDENARWSFVYWTAMCLKEAQRHVTAQAWLDSYIQRFPGQARPLAINAEFLYMRGGDDENALKLAQEAVRLAPDDDWNHYLVAAIAARLKNKELALSEINEAIRIKPSFAIYEELLEYIKQL